MRQKRLRPVWRSTCEANWFAVRLPGCGCSALVACFNEYEGILIRFPATNANGGGSYCVAMLVYQARNGARAALHILHRSARSEAAALAKRRQ